MDEYIVVDKGYRLVLFSIYYRRQCTSMDSFPQHIVRAPVFGSPSVNYIVTDNGYRRVSCTFLCGRQWL